MPSREEIWGSLERCRCFGNGYLEDADAGVDEVVDEDVDADADVDVDAVADVDADADEDGGC